MLAARKSAREQDEATWLGHVVPVFPVCARCRWHVNDKAVLARSGECFVARLSEDIRLDRAGA